MLLAIDVGNTNTLFAVHDGTDWVVQWRSATDARKTADDHAAWLWRLADMHDMDPGQINGCLFLSTVCFTYTAQLTKLAELLLVLCSPDTGKL